MIQTAPIQPGHFTARVLQFGATGLAIGVLVYLASRSVGGGLAGVLLSGLFSWLVLDLALAVVRDVRRASARVEPRHKILGGCLGAIAACGIGGLLLLFGYQLILGFILGGVASLITNRTSLPTLAQLGGLDSMAGKAVVPSISHLLSRPAAAIVALVCVLIGIAFAGVGTYRGLEASGLATDFGCVHPCGMVHGLWVQVVPDSQGDFVARLDPVAVRLRVRFWNDAADNKTVNLSAFTLTYPPVTYEALPNRTGCDQWPSRTLRLDESTGVLPLCFAIPESQNVNFDQLVLEWAPAPGGGIAPILLGKKSRSGMSFDIQIGTGASPSPTP